MNKHVTNHRVCEACWSRTQVGIDAFGRIRQPTQVVNPEPAPCCYCGELCFLTGIYIRADNRDMRCHGLHSQPWLWSSVRVIAPEDATNGNPGHEDPGP